MLISEVRYIHQRIILARKAARQVEAEIGNYSMSRANLELHEEPARILVIRKCEV